MCGMAPVTPSRVDFDGSYVVRIRAVFNSGMGKLLNLSLDGAYVTTPMYLLPQAQVHLQISVPNENRWIETQAVVAWENRGKVRRGGLPPGYGMRFIKVPGETVEVIQKLLDEAGGPASEPVEVLEPTPTRTPAPPPGTDTVKFDVPSHLDLDFGVDLEPEGPPYRLAEESIVSRVPEDVKGIFVLSYDRTQDALVGRSDDDLRATLSGFVGQYAYFYHEMIEIQEERFHRECELYHRFGGDRGQLDNTVHPAPPAGSGLSCPVCTAGDARAR